MVSVTVSMYFLPSIFLILTYNCPSISGQTECISNFTSSVVSSRYRANRGILLSSLNQNIDDYGFYNTSAGTFPDAVYGSAFCRADIQLRDCRSCIQNATIDIQQSCPNAIQAISYSDLICTLRYSNESMFQIMAEDPGWFRWSNRANVSNPQQFNSDLRKLVDVLRVKAGDGGSVLKVAVGNVSTADFQTVFTLLQCTPDLSQADCNTCLLEAIGGIPGGCRNSTTCLVLNPSCNLLYALVPFYNQTRLQELNPSVPRSVPSSPPPPPLAEPPAPPQSSPPPPSLSSPPPPGKKTRSGSPTIIIGVVSGIACLSLLVFCLICFLCAKKRKKKSVEVSDKVVQEKKIDESIAEISSTESLQYDFAQIVAATNGFAEANKLGEGGFGDVYWGKLPNGVDIAAKRLSMNSLQGDEEFKNEVNLVARLQHRNLVGLLGYSMQENKKLLIYEFVENASLDRFIFDPNKRPHFPWEIRRNIVTGIAKGLLYLHEDSRFNIVHRDLKASNVLLDKEMRPKIADFGMARLLVHDGGPENTQRIVGTYGYMAPEYAMQGQFSTMSDVYSFGVLVMEIVSGQKNNFVRDGVNFSLLSYAWKYWCQRTIADIIDPLLNVGPDNFHDIMRCIHVGLLCVQETANSRPKMVSVVQMLSNSSMSLPLPTESSFVFKSGSYPNSSIIDEDNSIGMVTNSTQNHSSFGDLYPR